MNSGTWEETLHSALSWMRYRERILGVVVTVLGPAMFTLALVFRLEIEPEFLFWLLLIGSLTVWLGGEVLTFLGPTTPIEVQQSLYDLQLRERDRLDEIDNLERLLEINSSRAQTLRAWLDLLAAFAADGKVDEDEFHHGLHTVLSPLVRNPDALFEAPVPFHTFWTASVYLYSPKLGRLCAVERETNQDENPHELGRAWPTGQGQVGFAYQRDRLTIVADLQIGELARQMRAPEELSKPQDAERYRCIAAIPLRSSHRAGDSLGCLIVTVDSPDQLSDPDDRDILEGAAACICTLLSLHNRNADDILQSKRPELF